jgi:hypothetical protein
MSVSGLSEQGTLAVLLQGGNAWLPISLVTSLGNSIIVLCC